MRDRLAHAVGRRLEHDGHFEVVGAASTPSGVVEMAGLELPDVIVVDERIGTKGGWHVARLRAVSDAQLLVLVDASLPRRGGLPLGANAYLALRPPSELADVLVDVVTIAESHVTSTGLGSGGA